MEVAFAPGVVTVNKLEFREKPNVSITADYPSVVTNPNPPTVQLDQNLEFEFDWTQTGAIFSLALGPQWELEVLFTQKGGGGGGYIFSDTIAYVNVNGHIYNKTVNINAGSVAAGLYQVSVMARLRDTAGLYPIAFFQDLCTTLFFKA